MKEIYLDNAATSWPKPEEVCCAVEHYMRACGGTPARGKHPKALEAGRVLEECREGLKKLLGARPDDRLVLTSGATEALNLALKGLLPKGAHVAVAELEHNSVFRPLSAMAKGWGVRWTLVPSREDGTVDPARVSEAILPETRLVICSHASNVLGTRVDIEAVARAAHKRGVPVLIDAAQTVGAIPMDAAAQGADLIAFTGHKSLLGPPGTGGLLFREGMDLAPLKEGGTGTLGELPVQPLSFPDRYESGSPNMCGIAGLAAGARFLRDRGVDRIAKHKSGLVALLREELLRVPRVEVYGTPRPEENVGILSFNVADLAPERAAELLWERSGIMVRAGLHCAPFVHGRIGTRGRGTVRVGIGWATTRKEIVTLVEGVREVA